MKVKFTLPNISIKNYFYSKEEFIFMKDINFPNVFFLFLFLIS